jgi:threonine dehydratase
VRSPSRNINLPLPCLSLLPMLGNHAQGVALSGSRLNIPCTIVMPNGTPAIKVRNVSRLGAKVILHGVDFDEAKAECARLASSHGLTFVPPYDDPLVIAGQGTVGAEILKQAPDSEALDAIFAAVGGGGLVAGISAYVKRIGSPHTQVIGAETLDSDAMARSLEKGERVTLTEVGPFSDGTAVKIVGEEPFRICKDLLDGIVKVDNDELCAAIKDIFEGRSIFLREFHSDLSTLLQKRAPSLSPQVRLG